jgi:hypothetical protein
MDQPKDKYELMAIALQQRIGELVMMYEAQIASLRADITLLSRVNDIANGSVDLADKK